MTEDRWIREFIADLDEETELAILEEIIKKRIARLSDTRPVNGTIKYFDGQRYH